MKKVKHFLSINDLSQDEFWQVLKMAKKLKSELKKTGKNPSTSSGLHKQQKLLAGKTLGMIFEKPSLRTRISFEAGMMQLGGHAIYLGPSDIGLGKREAVSDIGKVTSSMVDIIMARTFKHEHVVGLAESSSVPVINALTDKEHPCQILADLMTVWEVKGKLEGLKLVFVGDCDNNVASSLELGCKLVRMEYVACGPKHIKDVGVAVGRADVVVTDTWVSMGDEKEKEARLKLFKPYQVDVKMMKLAKKDAIFMHCLPAYRGLEVTDEVIDSKQSVVFEEAENRLHAQKALILWLLGIKI